MKRTAITRLITINIVAVLLLCFSCCDKSDTYVKVTEAVENTVAMQRYRAKFVAEMKFEDATLFFAQGTYSIDREKQLSYSDCVQSYLGTSNKLIEMYSDGYVYTDFDGDKSKYEKNAVDFFNYLYYAQAINFDYDYVENLEVDTNSSGTLYRFTVEGGYDDQLLTLMGEDIYSLAKIKVPQKDKTRFSEIECEYTVSDNGNGEPLLTTRQILFTMYLYDTPAYTPGYTPPEEDYMLALQVRLRVSYEAFSDEVTIESPVAREYSLLQ